MKHKGMYIKVLGVIVFIALLTLGVNSLGLHTVASQVPTDSVAIQHVSAQIQANGSVTAQTQATLHFQTAGKLVYLPFQKGDSVNEGQTIAQLDTYQLQRQLTTALNNYRSQRDVFDQQQEYNSTGVLQNQQSTLKSSGADLSVINDTVKNIIDENQATLDNSVINVELANYALQLATVTSPISGVIINEDVTTSGQNITTTTGFTVADLSTLVFRANINESDIDFVQPGATAQVRITGIDQPLSGVVAKVYPNKQTLSSGQSVYQADISVTNLPKSLKMDQTGFVTITSTIGEDVMLVPSWTILHHNAVWVEEDGKSMLKHIVRGKTHGTMTEVTSGLSTSDRLIVNPASLATDKYQLL